MSSKIYLYQRIGNTEWATCDQSRFVELSSHRLFATKICYEEAAPVVERQPEGKRERFQKWVLAMKHPVLGFLDGHWLERGDDREGYANEYVQGLWVAYKAFAAPPELAELQATIAQLEERINRAINADFIHREHIAQQAAEIERLKGGQGEPVAWTNETTLAWMRKPNSGYAQVSACAVKSEPVALYTSQPAPGSVAISDEQIAKTMELFGEINEWNNTLSFSEDQAVKGCRAVLDKVKELNQ